MTIDSSRFLDFASARILRVWAARDAREPRTIPWTPLVKPLSECTVALVSTAGVARRDDRPFDEDGERRNPWWGDPGWRAIPQGSTEADVDLHHLHIDRRFGRQDLDVVLPMRRLGELAAEGVVKRAPSVHYSIMGYQLRTEALERETAAQIAADMSAREVDAAVLVPA